MNPQQIAKLRGNTLRSCEEKIFNHSTFQRIFREISLSQSQHQPSQSVIDALFKTIIKKWLHTREKEYLGLLNQDAPSTQVALRTMLSVATALQFEPTLEDVLEARVDLTPNFAEIEPEDTKADSESDDDESDPEPDPEIDDPEIEIEIDIPLTIEVEKRDLINEFNKTL